jgi:hypothetical protein
VQISGLLALQCLKHPKRIVLRRHSGHHFSGPPAKYIRYEGLFDITDTRKSSSPILNDIFLYQHGSQTTSSFANVIGRGAMCNKSQRTCTIFVTSGSRLADEDVVETVTEILREAVNESEVEESSFGRSLKACQGAALSLAERFLVILSQYVSARA